MFGKSGRLQYAAPSSATPPRRGGRWETGSVMLVMIAILASAITACAVELAFRLG